MYVDESGDVGMPYDPAQISPTPTRYFALSGLVVHELSWQASLASTIDFRRRIRQSFGIRLTEELHSANLLTKPGSLVKIPKHDRLTILRHYADELANQNGVSIISVVVDKLDKKPSYDPFLQAWTVLIQRFENTMKHRNFPGPQNSDERGIVVPDATDVKKLRSLTRKMRRYNPIPNQSAFGMGSRNLLMSNVIEDPWFKDSRESLFIQSADLSAFLLYQYLHPNKYMRSKQGQNYFKRLEPVLCKVASSNDPLGIVRL